MQLEVDFGDGLVLVSDNLLQLGERGRLCLELVFGIFKEYLSDLEFFLGILQISRKSVQHAFLL